MKKILSIVILVLALSALAVTASADKVVLYDPVRADFGLWSSDALYNYVTINSSEYADNVGVTSRTFDTTAASGSLNSNMRYQPIIHNSEGNYVHSGGFQYRWKSSFVWDFDFTFDQLPTSTGENGSIKIAVGTGYQNQIRFMPVNSTNRTYYIRWGGGTQAGTSDGVAGAISLPTGNSYTDSNYLLEVGKTYHLKIETYLNGSEGRAWVTFTNPYITDAATGLPYTKTTISPLTITTLTTVDTITNASNSANFNITLSAPMKFTLSNEELYVDKYRVMTPSVSLSEAQLSASATVVNATHSGYSNAVLPTLILAVYNENDEMVRMGSGIKTETIYGLTSTDCTAAVEPLDTLPDGTYTAKAFVWNNVDAIQPYPNCLVEKVLTVTAGTGVLSDPAAAE